MYIYAYIYTYIYIYIFIYAHANSQPFAFFTCADDPFKKPRAKQRLVEPDQMSADLSPQPKSNIEVGLDSSSQNGDIYIGPRIIVLTKISHKDPFYSHMRAILTSRPRWGRPGRLRSWPGLNKKRLQASGTAPTVAPMVVVIRADARGASLADQGFRCGRLSHSLSPSPRLQARTSSCTTRKCRGLQERNPS